MNVIHLITGRGPTGPAAAALLDVQALLAAGHKAWLATADAPALAEACRAEGLPHLGGFKLGRGALRLLSLPRDAKLLRALIRELAIDVLHVHRSDDQLLASSAVTRQMTTRLIRTWHRRPHPVLPLMKTFLRADGCVCVAREHAGILRAAGAPCCQFIHPAVNTAVFKPLVASASSLQSTVSGNTIPIPDGVSGAGAGVSGDTIPIPDGIGSCPPKPLIAQIGRWKRDRKGRDRGQRAALDVFQRLPRELPWQGILAGRGEMAEELRREAYQTRHLPQDRVRLIDFPRQTPAGFAQLLGAFSLGLVFTTGSDGASRPGVELLACGAAVLVADLPGLRELAEDKSCALLLPPNDPGAWAAAIGKLLKEPAQLAAMRQAARLRAEQVHGLKTRGEALAELYGHA
jgi:glycosyltransferase involved in cell wall biosynthesis